MKIRKGFVLREICGENIVVAEGLENIDFNKLITLNESAAYLWKELSDKEFTAEDMAALLISRYGIDSDLALKDSVNLCDAWHNAGIAE